MKIWIMFVFVFLIFFIQSCQKEEPLMKGEGFEEYINQNAVQGKEAPPENALINMQF